MKSNEKTGYLEDDFRIFHLVDRGRREFEAHYHDFCKILILLRGNVSYTVEGRSYDLKPYDIVLVNAGDIHRPVILDNSTYERIIFYVSKQFLSSYKDENYDLSYCFERAGKEHSDVLRVNNMEKSKLYMVCMELEHSFSDHLFANELYQRILFLEFMIQLNRTAIYNQVDYLNSGTVDSKLAEILRYINENLTEDITIDHLSSSFYLSRYYLMHYFKEGTGYTIGKYITEKRLMLAKNLVRSGCSVTEACYRSGFKNYSAFSRAFKKTFNTIPRNAQFLD